MNMTKVWYILHHEFYEDFTRHHFQDQTVCTVIRGLGFICNLILYFRVATYLHHSRYRIVCGGKFSIIPSSFKLFNTYFSCITSDNNFLEIHFIFVFS